MVNQKTMGVKGKNPVAVSDSDSEPDQTFKDAEAKARYEDEIRERPLHLELGFAIKKEPNYGLTPKVGQIINRNNWKKFAAHPRNPVVPLVREFYANIISTEPRHSMVRGVKVSFSAQSINLW